MLSNIALEMILTIFLYFSRQSVNPQAILKLPSLAFSNSPTQFRYNAARNLNGIFPRKLNKRKRERERNTKPFLYVFLFLFSLRQSLEGEKSVKEKL